MSSITALFQRLRTQPLWLVILLTGVYLVAYVGLLGFVGPIIGTLASLPVLAIGWAWGARAGLLAGVAFTGIDMLLHAGLGHAPLSTVLSETPGYIILVLVGGIIGWLHDLTVRLRHELTRRQAIEDQLAASQARFRALIEHSSDGVTLIAPDGTVTFTSPAAERILGAPSTYWIGGDFRARVHPDDAERITALWAQVLTEPGRRLTAEFRYQHFDGTWRWLEVTGTNRVSDPAVQAVVINYHDVTERHTTHAALEVAERQYRTLVEHIPAILYIANLDETGSAVYNSPQIIRLGYTPEQYAADPELWLRSIHPDDRARVLAELNEMRTDGTAYMSEYRVLHPDGRVIWVQDEAVVIRDESGRPHLQQGVVVDVTARKEAEAALVEREQRFRALIEHAADMIGLIDAAGRITYVSPSVEKVLGYTPTELIGSLRATRTHPDDQPALEAQLTDLRERPGATITARYRTRHKAGHWLWVESRITNLLHEPSVAAIVFNFRDITERVQHERELEALVGAGAAVRVAGARADMLRAVLSHVISVLELDGATLALRETTSDDLINELSLGRWAKFTGTRLKPGEGISGAVIGSGQPFVAADVHGDPRFAQRASLAGMRAVAVVPLRVQQEIIGTLSAAREAEFSTGEVRLLTAMAELAASAIQRVTLLEAAQRGFERLAALRTIERAISNSLDLRLTLHILLEQVSTLLAVDAAVVLLLDPETQTLRLEASRGLGVHRPPADLRLGQGRAGRVALDRQRLELLDFDLSAGVMPVEGFRAYVGLPLISKGEVQGVLEIYHRSPLAPLTDWWVFLEALAGQAAIAINNAQLFTSLQDSNVRLTLALDATLEGWAAALDQHSHGAAGHSLRVANLALLLAQELGLSGDDLVLVRRGALLHELGMLAVPERILLKPGPLAEDEWRLIQQHPRAAHDQLAGIHYLRPALDIPYCHHERWNGSGYPRGLRGTQTPLSARVVAVADVWDALCAHRPYRPAWSPERARAHLRAESGRLFDPAVVEAFLRLEAAGNWNPA